MILPSGLILPRPCPPDFKPHLVEGMTDDTYHGMHDHLSSSWFRKILKSPAHFIQEAVDRQKGGQEKEEKHALRFGRAAHAALLEPERYKASFKVIPDFGTMRSSTNRDKRDRWIGDQPPGSVIVTEDEFELFNRGVEGMLQHKDARRIFEAGGLFESSIFYKVPGIDVLGRVRPDLLCLDPKRLALWDFKTTTDVSYKKFQSKIVDFRYDVQMAKYKLAIEQAFDIELKIVGTIVMESKPPHCIAVYPFDDSVLDYGLETFQAGIETLSRCMDKKLWPGVQEDHETMHLPPWFIQKEIPNV